MRKKILIIVLSIIIVFLTVVLLFSKYVTSHHIKIKEYAIIDKKLPSNYHGLKIVHISDILYGKSTSMDDVKKMVEKINKLNPDIVVFTGDLFSKYVKPSEKELNTLKNYLSSIDAKYEKFAIIGDNDKEFKDQFYNTISDSFTILDNESTLIYIDGDTPIRITGLNNIKKEEIFNKEENFYTILLLHKPDEIEKVKNKYDVALSGHSIGGQIKIPFYGPLIKLDGAKKYTSGRYEYNDTILFVNDGIGSQNTNMRINNNPKINFYRFYQK